MAIRWVDVKGKKILYADYRDRKTEQDMIKLLDEVAQRVSASPFKVLVLSDFTDSIVTTEYMKKVKQYGKDIFIHKMEKNAVIGISGLKVILLQGYLAFTGDKNTKAFQTESEAFQWLSQ